MLVAATSVDVVLKAITAHECRVVFSATDLQNFDTKAADLRLFVDGAFASYSELAEVVIAPNVNMVFLSQLFFLIHKIN